LSALRRGSLTFVGTGIRLVSQMTPEAMACIRRATKLFYLVVDGATETWLRRLNKTAESLADCYAQGKPRQESYVQMVGRILPCVRAGEEVCVAFYGHPGVFVWPSHEAMRIARREGFPAKMLPAISAEDCLFADLGIDPARDGCQSFEVTDFLLRRRRFDTSCSLILWQIGVIGELSVRLTAPYNSRALGVLANLLRRHYPAHHEVVIYEAARYPIGEPSILRVPLSKLGTVTPRAMATLYVPPRRSVRPVSARMLGRLGMATGARRDSRSRQRGA